MKALTTSTQNFTTKAYFFGQFVLDLERGCLVREGNEVKLRPKSYELLRYLVERHGRLFSKEELIHAVWPDSFVTDDSLVQCVVDIRRALDDESQRYIKTIPKRGYIFHEPVSFRNGAEAGTIDTSDPHAAAISTEEAKSVGTVPPPASRAWLRIGIGLLGLAVVGGLAWYRRPVSLPPTWEAVPLTSYPGVELNPAISPDGNTVAFTWNGEAEDNSDIYVQAIGSSRPQRLTTNPAVDMSPAWSPDGKTIAFLRRLNAERNQLILIPAIGGPENVLTETRNTVLSSLLGSTARSNVAWTPDGQWIAVPHHESDKSSRGLSLVSVLTGSKRPLTQPPAGYFDENPAFSRGRTLAFARRIGTGGSDLFVQALSTDFVARDPLKRLTTSGQASKPVWTNDGQQIVYVASGSLRIIGASSPDSSRSLPLEGNVSDVSLQHHLVYSVESLDTNVWRAELRPAESSPVTAQLLIWSTRLDGQPQFSPDGKKIAFRSNRSGRAQIWISNADGSSPVQLTSFSSDTYYPMWSPDGVQILFHARLDGQAGADLFSVPASGGPPKRLTTDPSNDVLASYSRDGHWIYFGSNRSGQREIWKMPAAGGDATRITDGAMAYTGPLESSDGTLFYAHENPEKGIWKIPVGGGNAEQVTGPTGRPNFTLGAGGIYYASAPETPTRQLIRFLSFSTGQSRPVVVANQGINGLGMSLSPDERYLLFTQRDHAGSDLMIVKDFVAPR